MTPAAQDPYNVVIVCPTWACNFRCWYCYQDHADVWMQAETATAVTKFLDLNSLRSKWLWLEFFGGEPLLCPDTILQIAGSAQKCCSRDGLPFFCGMTTNGYLLEPELFAKLCGVGMNHMQITLDGDPLFHDQQRTLASGRGSWDRIWNNLTQIRAGKSPIKIVLRVHFQLAELEHATRLIEEYINPTFASDERFSIQFEEIKPLGGLHDDRIKKASHADHLQAFEQLSSALARPAMLGGLTSSNYDCYASKSSTIVVTPEGELAKCTVSLDRIGHLTSEGHVALDAGMSTKWSQQVVACPNCPRSQVLPTEEHSDRLSLPILQ